MKYTIILLILLVSCSKETNTTKNGQLKGRAFGTYYYIKTTDDKDIEHLRQPIEELIDSINDSMSTYQESSLISKLNRSKKAVVDDMFLEVIKKSRIIHEKTNGYFDPTAGLLVNYYGFGSETQQDQKVNLDSLREYVNLDLLEISGDTLIKEYKRIYVDLNSIAKGYAVDQFVKLLKSKGLDNFLVDIGGEVYAKGNKPNGKQWKIGINEPIKNKDTSKRKLSAKVGLKNKAMATSGNYLKFKIDKKTNKETVHTINPLSGKAKPSSVLSASVIMDDCMSADAYATAMMAMGHEKAIKFIEKESLFEAYLIYRGKEGKINTYVTNGFKEILED
jgi:thiamine biosynthesis lipoprotein